MRGAFVEKLAEEGKAAPVLASSGSPVGRKLWLFVLLQEKGEEEERSSVGTQGQVAAQQPRGMEVT